MESDERLQKAIRLAQQAADSDREGKYEEAFHLYKMALDNWQIVCKYQSNNVLKERLYKKMEEYVSRAEQIKVYLEKQKQMERSNGGDKDRKKLPQVLDGGHKGASDSEQTEENKMKDKLGGAIVSSKPNVKWSDIAGLESAKEALQEAVILPTRFPNLFTGERKPWRGILLYGPPGTGKTYLAKACATEADATFLSVSSADLISKWQGESEKLVRTLFEMARERKPAIIFIDEVDSMCGARSDNDSESSRRIKTEFLVQMQGVGNDDRGVLILGATNVPWGLDSAIRRRFERRVYIPLPSVGARKKMFALSVGKTLNNLTDADFLSLAQKTENYSGADISIIVRDALFQPVRKCRTSTHFKEVKKNGKVFFTPCSPGDKDVTKKEMSLMSIPPDKLLPPDLCMYDFLTVLSNTRPSVSIDDLKKYETWTEQFGVEGN